MASEEPSDPKKQKQSSYLRYSSLALQMFATIGLAAWAGYEADQYFELKFPAFLLTLVFAAFGGMMYKLYQSINKE
jgi:hypothetical protein